MKLRRSNSGIDDAPVRTPNAIFLPAPGSGALPGRARKRRRRRPAKGSIVLPVWLKPICCCLKKEKEKGPSVSTESKYNIALPIALWYCLGVVSIASSKLLLSTGTTAVPPLVLTFQQVFLGQAWIWMLFKFIFTKQHSVTRTDPIEAIYHQPLAWQHFQQKPLYYLKHELTIDQYLCATGFFFTAGFLFTNIGFSVASASFVETIKAVEPLSSAAVAVGFQLEPNLSPTEWSSLGVMVVGMMCSTVGNAFHAGDSSLLQSVLTTLLVLTANACFSIRGVFQKWFRQAERLDPLQVESMNDCVLQYHLLRVGVLVVLVPTVLLHGYGVVVRSLDMVLHTPFISILYYYIAASINAAAFASYNLASSYLLSRIPVTQHAAWNGLRRVFAIAVTSILFQVSISWMGVAGIILSVASFWVFSQAAAERKMQSQTISRIPATSSPARTSATSSSSSSSTTVLPLHSSK